MQTDHIHLLTINPLTKLWLSYLDGGRLIHTIPTSIRNDTNTQYSPVDHHAKYCYGRVLFRKNEAALPRLSLPLTSHALRPYTCSIFVLFISCPRSIFPPFQSLPSHSLHGILFLTVFFFPLRFIFPLLYLCFFPFSFMYFIVFSFLSLTALFFLLFLPSTFTLSLHVSSILASPPPCIGKEEELVHELAGE